MVFILIAVASFLLVSFLYIKGKKKNVSPERTTEQQQTDELITVVLPTINKSS